MRRADLDCLCGERGQRDRGQAYEQEAADALEQDDGAALPRRANRRAERYARRRIPSSLSWLSLRERRRGYCSSSVMNPTALHAPDHLARDHLKMALLLPVSTADVAAIKPNHDGFGWLRRGRFG